MLNKGFAMVDLLVIVLIISGLNLITLNLNIVDTFKGKLNTSLVAKDILEAKNKSILHLSDNCVESKVIISKSVICYNKKGNINMAQTIQIPSSRITMVLHLGSGIYEIK